MHRRHQKILVRAVLGAILLARTPCVLHAQEPTGTTARDPATTQPTPAPDGRHLPDEAHATPADRPRLDDEVPRPVPARGIAGPNGDQILEPASGDPFFLGFIPGDFFPPAEERLAPELLALAERARSEGRPDDALYAFAMFAKRITPERILELEALDVRVLGFHPHHALKVTATFESLQELARHPAIRWVGPARTWQKVHPEVDLALQGMNPDDALEAYVSVFESDLNPSSISSTVPFGATPTSPEGVTEVLPETANQPRTWMSHGWQERALRELGVLVDAYLPEVTAFQVRLTRAQLERVVERDFVLFVDPVTNATPAHDESTPLIGADIVRNTITGGTNSVAIVGIIDSGYAWRPGLNHIEGLGWDFTGSNGPWNDLCGHGSHVAGTILGESISANPGLRGVAPGLGWGTAGRVRVARAFLGTGFGSCGGLMGGTATLFSVMRNPVTFGGVVSGKPHVVNNSWGSASSSSSSWTGTETDARLVDDEVWNAEQLYVFAAGNEGSTPGSIRLQPSAKNAFAVASVIDYRSTTAGTGDPGARWTSSSRGPCADGRWKPNIAAPGRWIESIDARSTTGYTAFSGTSMAAPHVTGVAAQLADAHTWTRHQPHRMAAQLMATAMQKDNRTLTTPTDTHLDEYGTGRVDPYRAVFGTSQMTWFNYGFAMNAGGPWYYGDFTVNTGATRLVAVLTYHEPAASAGASRALVNDVDFFLDQDPIDPGGNTGEWYVQQSAIDNTEIRVLNFPAAGPWRWKAWPTNVTSSARVSVAIHLVYGGTQPAQTLTVSATDTYVRPNERVDVTARIDNPSFVASGVYLDTTITSGSTFHSVTAPLGDGLVANLLDNVYAGAELLLGNVYHGRPRSATWETSWSTEGVKSFAVEARSENATNRNVSVSVTVDGTPPPTATSLRSTSHTIGAWSNRRTLSFAWSQAADNLSGVDGYGESWSSSTPTGVSAARDFGATSARTITLAGDYTTLYYGLRGVDRSGNWTSEVTVGPYRIDTVSPQRVTNLRSTSHTVNQWSNDASVDFTWVAATDDRSGVDGYSEGSGTSTIPSVDTIKDFEETVTTRTITFASSPSGWYYGIRAIDNATNAGSVQSVGPFLIDTVAPSATLAIASGAANTTLLGVSLTITGTDSLSGVSDMRFRNDGGNWSAWEPFATSKAWNLTTASGSAGTGTRRVQMQVRDRATNVVTVADTIYYYVPVQYFGNACFGSLGQPTFQVLGVPGLGRTISLEVANTSATTGVLYLGVSRTLWNGLPLPFDLGGLGSTGCFLNVSLDAQIYSGAPGAVSVPLTVDPSVVDVPFHAQWLLFGDPSGKPIVTTRGATLRVNGA
ncbi:MAG: S8 family serine peptidase [Planctomycetes bacterium]|nr:S8 family serine peptidase [Planctomycetota bacterium]